MSVSFWGIRKKPIIRHTQHTMLANMTNSKGRILDNIATYHCINAAEQTLMVSLTSLVMFTKTTHNICHPFQVLMKVIIRKMLSPKG